MRLLGRFVYLVILNVLFHYGDGSGIGIIPFLNLATAMDMATGKSSIYFIFAAFLLYGIGIFDSVSALKKCKDVEKYLAVRSPVHKRYEVYLYIMLREMGPLIIAKILADISTYFFFNGLQVSHLITIFNISVLYTAVALSMGLFILILYSVGMKDSVIYLVSFILLIFSELFGVVFPKVSRYIVLISDDVIYFSNTLQIVTIRIIIIAMMIFIIARNFRNQEFY